MKFAAIFLPLLLAFLVDAFSSQPPPDGTITCYVKGVQRDMSLQDVSSLSFCYVKVHHLRMS